MGPPLDEVPVADDRRNRAAADRQVGEEGLDRVPVERARKQRADGLVDEGPAVFPGYDQGGADLAALDHSRGDDDRVEEAKTGVRDVKDLGRRGKPNLAVGERRGGGFKHVPRHRGMDEEPDLVPRNRRIPEHRAACRGAGVGTGGCHPATCAAPGSPVMSSRRPKGSFRRS